MLAKDKLTSVVVVVVCLVGLWAANLERSLAKSHYTLPQYIVATQPIHLMQLLLDWPPHTHLR